MIKFTKLPRPSSYGDRYTGPDIWIDMSFVAYINDVFLVPRQTVSLGAPVTVQLIAPSFRAAQMRPGGTLVNFDLAGDDAHPKTHVGRIQVKGGLIVGISSSMIEDVSFIHLVDDKATTFIYLPSFRVEGTPAKIAEKLGLELA
jgi:hypothetical protein